MALIIEPQISTPSVTHEGAASGRLPDALLSEQVQRLAVCTAVGAGLWSYGLVMDTVVRPLTAVARVPTENVIVEIAAIAISVLMFLFVRYGRQSSQTKTDIGLLFFVVNAIAVALINTASGTAMIDSSGRQLSWNIVVILVSSMSMPSTPPKMLATSIVAASMDPLAVWLMHLRGLPVPSVVDTFVLYMPNYACAVVGILPSRVLQRLGHRLRQAQELGSYHLEELLGRGGMGEVWRGRHRLLKTSAAIKLVRPELLGASGKTEAEDMLIRFAREAQATAALSSPHTIRVFDFGVTADRTFYYVMEMLAGRDLASLVREFGPVPANRTLFLLRQVCQSLAEAHGRGLVHRDITPANIYVCRMGLEYDFVKVLDFGLVTSSDRSMEHTLMTGAHTTTGTPAFMAPEIILEGEVDERADVYALGCVAYYLLTGQLVFEADTSMKMFVNHLQTAPIPPSQRTELPVPREVDEFVLACLAKDPAKRPQNAAEALRLLGRCRSSETWDGDAAKAWWETHLLELTGRRRGVSLASNRRRTAI
jgi:eukaryotic-like serine/threonine-protein kinase